jgi:hypothetical protein
MTESRHQLLDDALAMSERMAALGDAGDWPAVIALEPERRSLLERAFATHAPLDEVIADRVKAILALDKRLMAQTVTARDGLAADISRATRGRKATSAYQAASR